MLQALTSPKFASIKAAVAITGKKQFLILCKILLLLKGTGHGMDWSSVDMHK
jgi:hypothetical protein